MILRKNITLNLWPGQTLLLDLRASHAVHVMDLNELIFSEILTPGLHSIVLSDQRGGGCWKA